MTGAAADSPTVPTTVPTVALTQTNAAIAGNVIAAGAPFTGIAGNDFQNGGGGAGDM